MPDLARIGIDIRTIPGQDHAALRPAYDHPPTVVLGPGEPQMAHQTNEHCLIGRVREAANAFAEIIDRWCSDSGPAIQRAADSRPGS